MRLRWGIILGIKEFFDFAYSSTHERASDTLECITLMPYERMEGLKEWNFGRFEGQSEELNPPHKPGETSYGDFFVQYGGESSKEVQERMNDCLSQIMEREGYGRVLVVSHGGACYMFLQKWLSFPEIKKRVTDFHNCCILKFTYIDGKFEFIEVVNVKELVSTSGNG